VIRRCVYCSPAHVFGETAPLEDRRFTDGLCPEAAVRENAMIDAAFGRTAQPGPLFFDTAMSQNGRQTVTPRSYTAGAAFDTARAAVLTARRRVQDSFRETAALARFAWGRLTQTRS